MIIKGKGNFMHAKIPCDGERGKTELKTVRFAGHVTFRAYG